ncbi:MAG: dihydropteroate synthase, partial [Acidobacteriota bacterium]
MQPRKKFQIKTGRAVLELGSKTAIMGILNVTPDSFSDKGKYMAPAAALDRAWEIASEGADILDIGAESTRPGSSSVAADEELQRLLPVREALGQQYPIPVS